MDFLSELDADVIAQLSNEDFEDHVVFEAKSLAGEAFDTYREVMTSSEDDRARIAAADKVLSLAGVNDNRSSLPSGVSEEVFKIALSGLCQLASIAKASPKSSEVLRNVTPSRSSYQDQDSLPKISAPINAPGHLSQPEPINETMTFVSKERYEINDRSDY